MFISSMWDVKEAIHYSKRRGHKVPGVVTVHCKGMGAVDKVKYGLIIKIWTNNKNINNSK